MLIMWMRSRSLSSFSINAKFNVISIYKHISWFQIGDDTRWIAYNKIVSCSRHNWNSPGLNHNGYTVLTLEFTQSNSDIITIFFFLLLNHKSLFNFAVWIRIYSSLFCSHKDVKSFRLHLNHMKCSKRKNRTLSWLHTWE